MPVEFIQDDDDAPEPSPYEPPPRRTFALRVLGAVVVLVAALIWALTRPDGGGVSGAARPNPSPHPPSRSASPPAGQTFSCRMRAPVTDELASAMRHFLPALRVANLSVYRCVHGSGPKGRVVFEAVSGAWHGQNIDVEVSVRGIDSPAESPGLGSHNGSYVTVARIETVAAGLHVSVVDWAPPNLLRPHVPGGAMSRLADFVSLNVVL
jgi:hypothetical protein